MENKLSIREKLELVTSQVTGIKSYVYNDYASINILTKRFTKADVQESTEPGLQPPGAFGAFPMCAVILPSSGRFIFNAGRFRDVPNVDVAFLRDAQRDFDGTRNDPYIEQMKRLAARWVGAFNASGLFVPIPDEIQYTPLYDIFSDICTGVSLNIQIEEVNGWCALDVYGYEHGEPPEPCIPVTEELVSPDRSTWENSQQWLLSNGMTQGNSDYSCTGFIDVEHLQGVRCLMQNPSVQTGYCLIGYFEDYAFTGSYIAADPDADTFEFIIPEYCNQLIVCSDTRQPFYLRYVTEECE